MKYVGQEHNAFGDAMAQWSERWTHGRWITVVIPRPDIVFAYLAKNTLVLRGSGRKVHKEPFFFPTLLFPVASSGSRAIGCCPVNVGKLYANETGKAAI